MSLVCIWQTALGKEKYIMPVDTNNYNFFNSCFLITELRWPGWDSMNQVYVEYDTLNETVILSLVTLVGQLNIKEDLMSSFLPVV